MSVTEQSTPGKLAFSAAKPNAAARRTKSKPRDAPVVADPSEDGDASESCTDSSTKEGGDSDSDVKTKVNAKAEADSDEEKEDGEDEEEEEGGEEGTDSDASSVKETDAFEEDHVDTDWECDVLYGAQERAFWLAHRDDSDSVGPSAAPLGLATSAAPQPQPQTQTQTQQGAGAGSSANANALDVNAAKWRAYHAALQNTYGKLTTVKRTENRVHQILRYFDNMEEYGPCIGATRRERWDRAHENGLNPPQQIDEILNTDEGQTDAKYVQPVFAAKITDPSDEY